MENRSFGKSTDQQQTRATSGAVSQSDSDSAKDSFQISAPSISLPKGGGAIRGMGEKFAANPVTGTGSITMSIATSPGRSGFGPQLSRSYDSRAGNDPFGFGWQLSIPRITRKAEKGFPRFNNTDAFVISRAEDLVSRLKKVVDAATSYLICVDEDSTQRLSPYSISLLPTNGGSLCAH